MALPTSYANENEFASWMHSILGSNRDVSGYMSWEAPTGDSAGDYQDAVNEALAVYGVDDITNVTDIHLLHKIGRVELWRMVADRTVPQYDEAVRDAGTSNKLSQIHEHAKGRVAYYEKQVPRGYYSGTKTRPLTSQSVGKSVTY